MTPREAASLLGMSPQQVRTLIRKKRLKADRKVTPFNVVEYDVSPSEVKRYRKVPHDGRGWRRGKVSNTSNHRG